MRGATEITVASPAVHETVACRVRSSMGSVETIETSSKGTIILTQVGHDAHCATNPRPVTTSQSNLSQRSIARIKWGIAAPIIPYNIWRLFKALYVKTHNWISAQKRKTGTWWGFRSTDKTCSPSMHACWKAAYHITSLQKWVNTLHLGYFKKPIYYPNCTVDSQILASSWGGEGGENEKPAHVNFHLHQPVARQSWCSAKAHSIQPRFLILAHHNCCFFHLCSNRPRLRTESCTSGWTLLTISRTDECD